MAGTDITGKSGQTIVSTVQWDELTGRDNFSKATADFDAAVEKFFAPLEKAAKKAKKALERPSQDPAEYIVLKEAVKGRESQPAEVVALNRDSIILRLIEEGQTDRLVWVDESTLGVLAA
ncbi:MAG TPA: hypothetical protein PLB21_00485 [Actinomycetota bacterium]|nr:hypothetical protein [Actinomycetota bacterium]